MSVLSPKVRLVQNQLNDVLSVAMFLASAERTQHKDQSIGHDLEFHRGSPLVTEKAMNLPQRQ